MEHVKPANLAPAGEVVAVAKPASRILFVDNVRWVMILLVLSMHAAVTYSPFGSWYYREHPPIGMAGTAVFGTYQAVLQGFFMALLFFVSGYFVPKSYDAKGARSFMTGRLFRLGLPTLLFVAVLGPLTEYLVDPWPLATLGSRLAGYVLSGKFVGATGPLWFCVALLIFTGVYAGVRSIAPARLPAAGEGRVTALGVALVVLAMAATAFATRLVFPVGSAVLNMQLCYFPSYVIMFAAGVAASRHDWIRTVSESFAWTTAAVCVGAAMLAWLPLLALGGALSGRMALLNGGLGWQSAAMSLWEALICVGMSFGVLAGFRAWLPAQGRFVKFMSDNAFAVYVVHPPILVALALALAPVPLAPIAKFALLWALGAAVSFGVAAPIARRVPLVGRIL
ncbi:MAG TPA: acyltransferase [Caulobacteraceae bacterium]|nr:acyltransferase [Caulobacteraceae bacterium]